MQRTLSADTVPQDETWASGQRECTLVGEWYEILGGEKFSAERMIPFLDLRNIEKQNERSRFNDGLENISAAFIMFIVIAGVFV